MIKKAFLSQILFWMCLGSSALVTGQIKVNWDDYNLKGYVREIRTTIARNYPDTLHPDKVFEYEIRNDIRNNFSLGKLTFDENGFLSRSTYGLANKRFSNIINTEMESYKVYFIDLKDVKNKKAKFRSSRDKYEFLFPVIPVLSIRYNAGYEWFQKGKTNEPIYFKYKYKKNLMGTRIKLMKESWGSEEIVDHMLGEEMTRKYSYDKGLVSSQDLLLMPRRKYRAFEIVDLHMMDISIDATVRYTFEYDHLDRMQEIILHQDNRRILRETYAYCDSASRRPCQLERYIESRRTFGYHISNFTSEWYTVHGDITKSVNCNNDGETMRTRWYDYTYDAHNNWVECRMYLEGGPEKGDIPTIVATREIDYFSADEVSEK